MDNKTPADIQSQDLDRARAVLDRIQEAEKSSKESAKKSSAIERRVDTAPPSKVRRNLSRRNVIDKKKARKEAQGYYVTGAIMLALGFITGVLPFFILAAVAPLYHLIWGPTEAYNKAIKEWSKEQAPKIIDYERKSAGFKAVAIQFAPEAMTGMEAKKLEKAVLKANPDAKKELIWKRKTEIALPLTPAEQKAMEYGQPVTNSSLVIKGGLAEQVEWVEQTETDVWLEAVDNALEL